MYRIQIRGDTEGHWREGHRREGHGDPQNATLKGEDGSPTLIPSLATLPAIDAPRAAGCCAPPA